MNEYMYSLILGHCRFLQKDYVAAVLLYRWIQNFIEHLVSRLNIRSQCGDFVWSPKILSLNRKLSIQDVKLKSRSLHLILKSVSVVTEPQFVLCAESAK